MRLCATAVLLVVVLSAWLALAQQTPKQIVINVNEPNVADVPVSDAGFYLNGYSSSLSGETIEYHSSDPDADSALLVRGQSSTHSIAWQTDPVVKAQGEYIQFIWLGGLECAGFAGETDTHEFELLIDGERWFAFKNAKDSTAKKWKVIGKDGSELSFTALVTDHVGDLFGHMVMKIPARSFTPGKPLTLEVRGNNSGSPDWYMTFQHRFNFVPQLRAEPAVIRDGNASAQVIRLSLDNLKPGRSLEVQMPDHAPIRSTLKIGANILQLPIAAVTSNLSLPVVFKINGKLLENSTVEISPVRKREIYLLSYSHNDIGYTDLQPDVERKQWNNLHEAMRLIRETRDYPADSRYKWNMETIWALESYLKHASPDQRKEFFADVQDGSIGLSALYANILTGLASSVEMSHFFDFARELRAEHQFPMNTAVTSDVPGFSWGLVSALAQSGVKYFATAPNSGDRIGYSLQTWGDKPFYWASQSGKEKVLTWMAGASYSSFHEGTLSKLGDEKILKLVRKLDAAGYPYDMLQLPYTIADNGPPDPTLADFVRHWNERYITPHLVIATHEPMFEEFEKRYGSTLPVVPGDFTPYWEDGAASAAYETALNRAAVDRLIQGEMLWSMLSPGSYPANEFDAAWRNVIFFDEHTWGAHNSTEEPDLPFVKQQWEIKRKFALDADRASRELLARALPVPGEAGKEQTWIDVYNTNSWPRTDLVLVSPELGAAGDRVSEQNGHPVPSQRLSTRQLAVLVENVPPFAAKRLVIEKGRAYSPATVDVQPYALENDSIVLTVDPTTGAIDNLKWKKKDVELIDKAAKTGVNQYLYVLGTDPAKAQGISNVRVTIKDKGPLVASLLVEGDAPGAKNYSTEIRLIAGLDRLDLITNIDKKSVREKEGVHIAFPFAIPEGQLRYDVANGIVRPELDQLAGACKNFFSVQSWVDISNRDYGVTWSTPNAPLIEIGSMSAEQPWMKSIAPSTSFYSYIMNNYWHTNYKADQEGPVTFRYSIQPHAQFEAIDVVKFGAERRQPLVVAPADPGTPIPASLMRLSSPSVVVSSIKPIAGSHSWLAYLYNPTDKPQQVGLQWKSSTPASIWTSDAAGKIGKQVQDMNLPAFGSAYFRLGSI